MEIKFEHGENFVITLVGRLDTVTSTEVSDAIAKEKISEPLVIIEAKDVEYISSAGLRLLLALKKTLNANGQNLEIHHLNPINEEVFRVTGFNNILTIK